MIVFRQKKFSRQQIINTKYNPLLPKEMRMKLDQNLGRDVQSETRQLSSSLGDLRSETKKLSSELREAKYNKDNIWDE